MPRKKTFLAKHQIMNILKDKEDLEQEDINRGNCHGTPAFKSQRVGYQLLHHYQHSKNRLNS